MNKFNKGKKIGILTATLASVALAGVGFSTWIIGIQNTQTDGTVNIQADDVKYKSLTISTEFDKSIVLAESSNTNNSSNYFNYKVNEDRTANMTTTATFTLTIGRDYDANDFDFDQISLSFAAADSANNIVDNKPASDAVFTQTHNDTLTYFDVPSTIDITTEDKGKITFGEAADGSLTKKATFTKKITFTWGTMFGSEGKSPLAYYNTEVAQKTTDDEKNTYVEKAVKELDAMHAKYDAKNAKFKLNISFGKKGA